MRELIKSGAYSFVDGSRSLEITDGRSFSAQDVRLIINETKKIIIASSLKKDNILTVENGVITYSNLIAVLSTGDVLTIEIDFPQKELQAPIYTCPISFESDTVSFKIPETGVLSSLGDATGIQIKKANTNIWLDINLPYNVTKEDYLKAHCDVGCIEQLVIQRTSLSGNIISPGTLGTKILNGCNNFAYYSPTLSKVIIGGLAIFDEDKNFIAGDGLYTTQAYSTLFTPLSASYIEKDGYLYTYSAERGGIIKLNLLTGDVIMLFSTAVANSITVQSMRIIGDYLYVYGGYQYYYINLVTLATGILFSTSSNQAYMVIDDGVSVYSTHNNSIHKVTNSADTSLTVTGLYEAIAESGDYVYACKLNTVIKISKATWTIVSTITTNRNSTVSYSFCYNNYLYTCYGDGNITMIDLATFSTIFLTVNTGTAITSPCIRLYNNKAYIISRGANVLKAHNLLTNATNTYNLINDANAFSIDPINERIILYSYQQLAGITLKPVEIINIP